MLWCNTADSLSAAVHLSDAAVLPGCPLPQIMLFLYPYLWWQNYSSLLRQVSYGLTTACSCRQHRMSDQLLTTWPSATAAIVNMHS